MAKSMLRELHIKNFVIIEDEQISFSSGLNVISGETGSGKSMLLQAIELILGGRPHGQYVRAGTEGWEIEALFDLSVLDARSRELLPSCVEQAEELLLMRSMNSAGRGKIYINGRLGTVSLLEEIAAGLVNICGQGQHVRLLDARYHLELLDGFAENEALLMEYSKAYNDWQTLNQRLLEITKKEQYAAVRRVEIETILSELTKVEIRAGIRTELEEKVKKMANAEEILQLSAQIEQLLNGEHAIYAQFAALDRAVMNVAKLENNIGSISELLASSVNSLQDFEQSYNQYLSNIEIDEEQLETYREHLAEVARLERKYRCNDAGLLKLRNALEQELAEISDPECYEKLKKEVDEKKEAVLEIAYQLSAKRKEAAMALTKQVAIELKELNMPSAVLEVEFLQSDIGLAGVDKVEILISTNKGEPCKPLKSVASGGELSRIMLVLKKILRDRSGVNVLVFDEVDTGISGGVARAVGEKLKALSARSQVLCITHLAQVASLGERHLLVEKIVNERTQTKIRTIEGEERVDEIARMLAGYKITEATRVSAKELLAS